MRPDPFVLHYPFGFSACTNAFVNLVGVLACLDVIIYQFVGIASVTDLATTGQPNVF